MSMPDVRSYFIMKRRSGPLAAKAALILRFLRPSKEAAEKLFCWPKVRLSG